MAHRRLPLAMRSTVSGWVYAHLFMTMGIAATGAAISNVIELAGEPLTAQVRWLLAGAVSLAFLSVATIMHVIRLPEGYQALYRTGRNITLVSALAILLLGFSGLSTLPLLLLLVLMLVPIFHGVKVWIVVFGAEEVPIAWRPSQLEEPTIRQSPPQ